MANLEKEMEIWEQNANDEFGKLLKEIEKESFTYWGHEKNEFGIFTTPISHYRTSYALDGPRSRKWVAYSVKHILENADIIPGDKKIKNLVDKLSKLS